MMASAWLASTRAVVTPMTEVSIITSTDFSRVKRQLPVFGCRSLVENSSDIIFTCYYNRQTRATNLLYFITEVGDMQAECVGLVGSHIDGLQEITGSCLQIAGVLC